jgi:chromosome segregation ATPase
MSDNVLKRLASDMQELEELFREAEGLSKSADWNEDMRILKRQRDMLSKHRPGTSWSKDALESAKVPHDIESVKDHVNSLAFGDDEDTDSAEANKEEIVHFIQNFKRGDLYRFAGHLEDIYHLIYATLQSVDEDIKKHDYKEMASKLEIMQKEIADLERYSRAASEDYLAYADAFIAAVKSIKG